MVENTIYIAAPHIVVKDGSARLEADTMWCFDEVIISKTLYYEVESKWAQYLTTEFSDPFVLAVLELAMERGCDIFYETPMSADLKYQLETYLIPVYSRKLPPLNPINLVGTVSDSPIESENVVGAGFSGGVDSFYSVLKHIDSPYKSKRVTHLVLAVNGSAMTGFTEEIDKKWFREESGRLTVAAKQLGLEFLGINSNVSLVNEYKNYLPGGSVIPTASFIHALRKLFGTYYWGSSYEADVLEFRTDDGNYMDPFVVPLMSVSGLRFYHSGCEVSRIEKVEYIADNVVAQNYLNVCGGANNCGTCFKCLRTMAELNSIGKLDKFSAVFDVGEYEKKYVSRLAREFAIDHEPFSTDIRKKMKQNGVRIPLSASFASWLVFKPYYYFRKTLRNNKLAQRVYYSPALHQLLGEARLDEAIVAARMEHKGKGA